MKIKCKWLRKLGRKLSKHAPTILTVGACTGVAVTAYTAIRGTLKFVKEAEDLYQEKSDIIESMSILEGQLTDEEIHNYELALKNNKKKFIITGVKCYAGTLIAAAGTMACAVTNNIHLTKSLAASTAATATINGVLNRYRNNVKERFGEDVDYQLRHGIKPATVTETITDEKGKTKEVTKDILVADKNSMAQNVSDYSRFFDNSSDKWQEYIDEFGRGTGKGDNDYNLCFLKAVEAQCNNLLKHRKILFLNEVYTMLGFKITEAGQRIGWVYDDSGENNMFNNYVDFGLYDLHNPGNRRCVNGLEDIWLLDFNVDGDVTPYI